MNPFLRKVLHMSKKINLSVYMLLALLVMGVCSSLTAQEPYRVGTTAANFLEIGVGVAGNAMGDANVALTHDLMSSYWNPAGLGFMKKSEAHFVQQPYVANISMRYAGVGLVLPNIATLAVSVTHMGYGDDMAVTTLAYPEGTGEHYSADDFAFSLSVGRRLVHWFAFGMTAKFINSQIWHTSGKAAAVDFGAIVNTNFFSSTGNREDGMKIGMSIANYGSGLSYDGIDLYMPIDLSPDEAGNYADVPGKYKTSRWELPLIFRLGIGLHRQITSTQRLSIGVDALHPNNNSEYVNVGGEYQISFSGTGDFFLRGGYKGLGMIDSVFGATFGGGFVMYLSPAVSLKFDYAYRSLGILGDSNSFGFGVLF